ncbi:MAG: DUF805 domain-containing protein [Cocleimonas sp.]
MNYNNNSIQRYSDVDVLSTQGRIGRKRYFVYSIVLPILIFWAIATVAALVSYLPFASNAIFYAILGIGAVSSMCMMVYLTIQRCHDLNKSAVLAILALIPFANIVFALIPGTNGLNSYGEVPVPATRGFKISFYALITVLIGLAIYAMLQLSNSEFFSNLLVF